MVTVQIDVSDLASPVLRAVKRTIAPERLKQLVGRSAVNTFRTHLFATNNAKPNALGGKRTNFYATAARGTHFVAESDGVLISVNQVGYRQRVLGGTIRPKRSKFLTIPANAAAHGKRAGEFPDLVVVYNTEGRPIALARAAQSLIGYRRQKGTKAVVGVSRKGSAGGEIMFWLAAKVTQRPDPSVAPTQSKIFGAVDIAINAAIARAIERNNQGGPQ